MATKHIVIVDKPTDKVESHPDRVFVTAADFIAHNSASALRSNKMKVVNLCRNYAYLSQGYYCSLLAEARSQRVVPSVSDIINLNWKRIHQGNLPELNEILEKCYREPLGDQVAKTFLIYFGRIENKELEGFARRVFDMFRVPIIAVEIHYVEGKWVIDNFDAWSIEDIPSEKLGFFNQSLDHFTGTAWFRANAEKKNKYWLAILHDPHEKNAPSNKQALQNFIKAGEKLGMFVELITKNDMSTLLEFDALFIRETTSVNHHTYRFAKKAEKEDIPCIDDTRSILRCSNKVFLHEMMEARHIPSPKTMILDKRKAAEIEPTLDFPCVVKIPDGSFSLGVYKVNSREEFHTIAQKLFKKSDIILLQEFMPSEFDWRVIVLNNRPLVACKYFMAPNHWQIYNHNSAKKDDKLGEFVTLAVEDTPKPVIDLALKACKLVGSGFYGVDMKQTDKGIFVIEVNDNPNIDAGVEDKVLGEELYKVILEEFIRLIEE